MLHANYWVSGAVGHRLKHELDLPLVTTFHTLERVKAEVGLATTVPLRPRVEAEVVRCADLVVASTREERDQLVRHYGADPERVEIVTPGRRPHRVLTRRPRRAPGDTLGLPADPCCCSSGASSRSRAPTSRCARSPSVRDRRAQLVVVGGPSGPDGDG